MATADFFDDGFKYSLEWSRMIVDRLWKAHGRGAETVCEVLNITRDDWVIYLAKADPMFPQLRSLAHTCDLWSETPHFPGWTTQMLSALEHHIRCKYPGRIKNRLDNLKYFYRIKEQLPR